MPSKSRIFRGSIWDAYNASGKVIREVLVVSSDESNLVSDFFQVVPLDDETSGRIHPTNAVKIRGKTVSVDLIITIPSSHFICQHVNTASLEDMKHVSIAIKRQLGL